MRALLAVLAAFYRALILSRMNLFLENAALRQQLAVLEHSPRRLRLHTSDRVFWVLLSRFWSGWRSVLVIVQPRTVIDWHRRGFRLFWRWRSRGGRPAVEREHRELIRRLSRDNPSWGEDRIRDELRHKLSVQHAASTVRRYMHPPEERRPDRERRSSQTWRTFLRNHAREIYACDFVTQWTAAFRLVYVFVVMELGSRRIVHINVTASPTLAWVKQQIREICAFGSGPRFLLHDNDGIFGQLGRRRRGKRRFRCHLDRWLATVMGVKGLPTPYRAPNANAVLERFNLTLRREALDHFVFLSEHHVGRVVRQYVDFYNGARPSQATGAIPDRYDELRMPPKKTGRVEAVPVLGGVQHDYRCAA